MTLQAVKHEDVRNVLQQSLAARGEHSPILSLHQRACDYASTYTVAEMEATLEGGRTLAVVFKDLGRDSIIESATAIKPAFILSARRELDVYRAVLPALGIRAAECYGAHADDALGRHWLFLEHVRGWHLWESEFPAFVSAARWLGEFHTRSAAYGGPLPPSLLQHDAAYYHTWATRAWEFVSGKIDGDRRTGLERLVNRYGDVAARIAAMPRHFIHGEFYPSNVLVRDGGTVCPIDWEMAAVGPALMDLAALTSGKWSPEHRDTLIAAYREALGTKGADWTAASFAEGLALCRLQVAMQWLGWSPHWTPPSMHQHDWLGEALALGEEVLT